MNKKYFDARSEYNIIKNSLNDSKAKITSLDNRLMILVVECVSLKTYISEVNRVIPVSLQDDPDEDRR